MISAALPNLFVNLCVLVTLSFVLSLTYRDWPPPPGRTLRWTRLALTALMAAALFLLATPGDGGRVSLALVPVVLMALRYGWSGGLSTGLPVTLLAALDGPPALLSATLSLLSVTALTVRARHLLDLSDVSGSLHRHGWVALLLFLPVTFPQPGHVLEWLAAYPTVLVMHAVGFLITATMLTSRVALIQSTTRYRAEAHQDALTGLANRRQFELDLPFTQPGDALLLIDLDHFKRVNDEYGHPVGDAVLRAVGQALTAELRGRDRAYRYGGEEFAVILRRVPPSEVDRVARRMARTVAELPPVQAAGVQGPPVTVSVGGATFGLWSRTRTLWDADEALYTVKGAGRNGVRIAGQSAAPSTGAARGSGDRPVEPREQELQR
ncbi:diguanylate cyclase [Deinococcus grandis]|uniref:Diguanylate cyclase n=1 Tax=Deinococcus grandis TaxID=57498 RepID=A0A100HMJ2_9DEIO|nr:GGDEF domain-containing protein [Deinococcus grandis]BBN96576.1 GGDEF domain-containing protein [Deinococcus grandis]GAQ23453.1 diguanylate cyclase [Deinococcus grandis]